MENAGDAYMISKIIGVAGRTCSGKSTAVNEMSKRYNNILHISQDLFFKRSDTDEDLCWEKPECLRNDLLIDTLTKLKKGLPTNIPSKGWTEKCDRNIQPKDYIIVEGYLLFVNSKLRDLFDYKVWIDVSDVNLVSRRLQRDGNLKYIDKILNVVLPYSKEYEQIQKPYADNILDGNIPVDKISWELERLIRWHAPF